MTTETETRRTDWIACKDGPWFPNLSHGGYTAYRIWQEFDGRHWFQRHEWKCADGSVEMEEWIRGQTGWCKGAEPVSQAA